MIQTFAPRQRCTLGQFMGSPLFRAGSTATTISAATPVFAVSVSDTAAVSLSAGNSRSGLTLTFSDAVKTNVD